MPLLRAMLSTVSGNGPADFNVVGHVVGLIAVAVMHNFAATQFTAELLHGDKAMFVGVPAHVGQRMFGSNFHQHVAVGGDDATALPLMIALAWLPTAMGRSIIS